MLWPRKTDKSKTDNLSRREEDRWLRRTRRGSKSRAHSHDHLLAAQQRVADELASSEGDRGVVVRHFVDCRDGLWVC